MATRDQRRPPAQIREYFDSFKAREVKEKKVGDMSHSLFVSGTERVPEVNAKVIPVEREIRGEKRFDYEVRIDIDGVCWGERAQPPGIETIAVDEHIPDEEIDRFSDALEAYIPEHISVDLEPREIMKAQHRLVRPMDEKLRYATTIFGTEDRQVFQDTSYPWGCFGRCETNLGPFSGCMIGPRHILTCSHGVDWTPPPGYAADWLKFTPAYYNGNEPFGSSYATHIYYVKKNDNDPWIDSDEAKYDYAVLVLADRLGDRTGYLGARRYTDGWDGLEAWWHIGYPGDLTSVERPTYEAWFSMDGDNSTSDNAQAIYHQADVWPGQSGGPMFGFWEGEVGPRAVAVQSWQNASTNGASGGGDLVDLVIRARNDHP